MFFNCTCVLANINLDIREREREREREFQIGYFNKFVTGNINKYIYIYIYVFNYRGFLFSWKKKIEFVTDQVPNRFFVAESN